MSVIMSTDQYKPCAWGGLCRKGDASGQPDEKWLHLELASAFAGGGSIYAKDKKLADIALAALRPYLRQPEWESIDFVEALKNAKALVEKSPLYRKFIDGTPLQNDIAVWMAEFAVKGGRL